MVTSVMVILFWLSAVVLFYTYFGYPILVWVISRVFYKLVKKKSFTPKVSLVIVAHNEEKYIEEKIKNILELDYPKENLEVIIGSDGSTDNTNEIIESYRDKGIKVVISPKHMGKINVLNKIVSQAYGEIVVFSDARQKFEKDAIKEMVANFADLSVGCVSGELIFKRRDESSVGQGVSFYWNYEKFIRKKESRIHSMIGATGAIYAIRKKLFISPPSDTLLDDVYIPLKIVEKGFRSIFDSNARAYDVVASSSQKEFKRKVRTLAGNFQLFIQFKALLNPFKNKIAWQFFSHKLLRAIAFVFLLCMFITNIFLRINVLYNGIFIIQTVFYVLALSGWVMEKRCININMNILHFPYIFCMLNFAALQGFYGYFSGRQKVTWK